MSPFDALKVRDAQTRLEDMYHPDADVNFKFINGDHWQDGKQWIGPRPDLSREPLTFERVMTAIKESFVSKNEIAGVAERHVEGVIGREPAWTIVPKEKLDKDEEIPSAVQSLIDEATEALVDWWEYRGIHAIIQELTLQSLWAMKSPIRIFTPRGLLASNPEEPESQVVPLAGSLQQALSWVFVDVPMPRSAGMLVDPFTMQEAGVYLYDDRTDGGNARRMEISFLDGGKTIYRVVTSKGDIQEVELELGGHMLLSELKTSKMFISPQIRQNQNLENMAYTMMTRNVVLGGFLERVFKGAKLPGKIVTGEDGVERWQNDPLPTGTGSALVLAPLVIEDAEGRKQLTNPDVSYRDPVPVETFVDTANTAKRNILEEARQLHTMIEGDAGASGVSRLQARASFMMSLYKTKSRLDRVIQWLLEASLALASQYAGQSNRYASLRVSASCRVDGGPLTSEERDAIMKMAQDGFLSRETAMAWLGVEDPDGEIEKIKGDRRALTLKQVQEMLDALTRAGITISPEQEVELTEMAGLTPRDVADITLERAQKEELETQRMAALERTFRPSSGEQDVNDQNQEDETA